jgi:hypothetical protein
MAKDLLVEPGRRMKTVDQADQTGTIELQKPMVDKETGETYLSNDLSRAKFDVVPDVGPSSSSRRAATVRALTGMLGMTADPETQTVLTSMVMMNMEGEGMGDVRAYYRNKLVRMGVIEPTEDEKQELAAEAQNQKPDPNAEYLAAAAGKAKADEALSVARVGETHAKTVAIMAKVGSGVQSDAIALADALTPGPIQDVPAQPVAPAAPALPGAEL